MLSLHLTLLHHVRRLLLQLEAPLAAFIIAAAVLVTASS